MKLLTNTAILVLILTALAAAASDEFRPISNPFVGYNNREDRPDTLILRNKRGSSVVEVEVPRSGEGVSEFVIPISPSTKFSGGRAPASDGSDLYSNDPTTPDAVAGGPARNQTPSVSDREITRTFPQGLMEDDPRRRDIEEDLGLVRSADDIERNRSYLAGVDFIKRLYRAGRYEAALLETDSMLKAYPTNPKLYEMRGTLLDRIGQSDLAIAAWKQALRFSPKNESLKRFIERKEQKRGLAGK